jgi:PleD family two-component response regulator
MRLSPLKGKTKDIFETSEIVLIVDGSKFIAHSYSQILMNFGYRVLIACDGKTGMFAAATCSPSLILLSMLLPDMDGAEALRDLKQTPSTSNIPVLIISSLSEKNAEGLIRQGAAGFLDKGSMTPARLENAISGILKKIIDS